jgi:polar amino acid transport system substrate-binding protein
MKSSIILLTILTLLLFNGIGLAQDQPQSKDLIATLAQVPGLIEPPGKGPFVDILKMIDDIYTDGNITFGIYPFARSIKNLLEGRADFHLPNFRNPYIPESKLPFRFVSEKIGVVSFVIYSNKDKIITRQMILDAVAKGGKFPYTIEIGAGSEPGYPFPGLPTNDLAQSLQKVQNKRVDAFIWAQEEGDQVVKELKLNAIRRSLWQDQDAVITIAKGPKADYLDKVLSECLRKLKASGRLQAVYDKVHLPYNNWQPSETVDN